MQQMCSEEVYLATQAPDSTGGGPPEHTEGLAAQPRDAGAGKEGARKRAGAREDAGVLLCAASPTLICHGRGHGLNTHACSGTHS